MTQYVSFGPSETDLCSRLQAELSLLISGPGEKLTKPLISTRDLIVCYRGSYSVGGLGREAVLLLSGRHILYNLSNDVGAYSATCPKVLEPLARVRGAGGTA